MTISMPRMDRLPAQERGLTIGDFLVPIRVSERLNTRLRHIALILIGTALIVLCARVSFYIGDNPVPFTGQTFGVLLAAGALGFRRGLASILRVSRARRRGPVGLRRRQARARTSCSARRAAT